MKRNLNRIIYIWRELGVTKGDGGTQLLSWSDPKIKESTTDWDTERSSILFSEGRTSTAISFPGGEFQSAWTLQHQWGTQYIYMCVYEHYSQCANWLLFLIYRCVRAAGAKHLISLPLVSFPLSLILLPPCLQVLETIYIICYGKGKCDLEALCSPFTWKGQIQHCVHLSLERGQIQHCVHPSLERITFSTVFTSCLKVSNSTLCSSLTWKCEIQYCVHLSLEKVTFSNSVHLSNERVKFSSVGAYG